MNLAGVGKTGGYAVLAKVVAHETGRPRSFALALAVIVIWGVTGPLFGHSDTWQLVINTSTTIITFLMVFLIQNTQTRDTQAMQIKLDELIRVTNGAHNALLDLEELEESQLEAFRQKYQALATAARTLRDAGQPDTGTPEAWCKMRLDGTATLRTGGMTQNPISLKKSQRSL